TNVPIIVPDGMKRVILAVPTPAGKIAVPPMGGPPGFQAALEFQLFGDPIQVAVGCCACAGSARPSAALASIAVGHRRGSSVKQNEAARRVFARTPAVLIGNVAIAPQRVSAPRIPPHYIDFPQIELLRLLLVETREVETLELPTHRNTVPQPRWLQQVAHCLSQPLRYFSTTCIFLITTITC